MKSCVRHRSPRLFTRICEVLPSHDDANRGSRMARNHFQSAQKRLSGVTRCLNPIDGTNIVQTDKPLVTALNASECMQTYRYAIVNAVSDNVSDD
jgi:hypothetical protein